MTSEPGFPWDSPAPTEHGKHAIEIELSYPVNPWEHEGAGAITWGAALDRLAPLGEDAVGIIKEAWEQQREHPCDRTNREQKESEPFDRGPTAAAGIKPGWASRVEFRQYWIRLTLSVPLNERWVEEAGENWSRGQLINDGMVMRSVTVEATTRLGRRALRIIEALHSAHPFNDAEPPERGAWYDS
ncbi:MAG: hypothetical protein ACXVHQ_42025 [Solirubrobacteraceae bacterium]